MKLSRRDMLRASAAGIILPQVFANTKNAWGQQAASPKAYSLHIGVNTVDTSKYPGGIAELSGCIADAKVYQSLIKKQIRGVNSKMLLSDSRDASKLPTRREVARHVYWAAQHMRNGDLFIVTYAGHGGQLRDIDGDESDDRADETWCLYDGQLRDDLLYEMWAQFDTGVRLLVISDSCHSGTVARERAARTALQRAFKTRDTATLRGFGLDSKRDRGKIDSMAGRAGRSFQSSARPRTPTGKPGQGGDLEVRAISEAQAQEDYDKRKGTFDDYDLTAPRYVLGDVRGRGSMNAAGLLLAGCQDKQFSYEEGGQGLFTGQFREAMKTSHSNYDVLLNAIVGNMPPNQTPNFFTFGAQGEDSDNFYYSQAPFTV